MVTLQILMIVLLQNQVILQEINSSSVVKIETLSQSAGLIYESVGKMQVSSGVWKIVSYISLENYYKKFEQIENYTRETENICKTDSTLNSTCHHFIVLVQESLNKLAVEKQLVPNLLGHYRVKRGYFNFVGDVSKTLFGTLSAEDADHFESSINSLNKKTNAVTDLLHKQTSIVKSTLENMNATIGQISHNEKLLSDRLNKLAIKTVLTAMSFQNSSIVEKEIFSPSGI